MTSNLQLHSGSLTERTGTSSTAIFQPDLAEISALLGMSRAIATVRDPRSLFYVLMQQLKPLVPFDDLPGLFVLNEDHTQYRLLFYDVSEEASDVTRPLQDWASQPTSVSDDPVSQHLLAHPVTQILSVADYQQQWPAHPGVVIAVSRGLSETLHLPLWYGERLLGFLSLNAHQTNTFSKRQFPLLSRIGDLLSIAVANILANEEILEREREKTDLLGITEAIAKTKNAGDLFTVIFQKIKPILHFDDAVIAVFNPDRQNLNVLATELTYTSKEQESIYESLKTYSFPNDDFFQRILVPEQVSIFSAADEFRTNSQYGYLDLMQQAGIQQTMCVPLYYGGEAIGGLFFHSTSSHRFLPTSFQLFKHVADQIAVAVANILANEDIVKREREKAILLSLSEDISSIRSRHELFETIANKIKAIFNYYDCSLHVVDLSTHSLKMWFHNFVNVKGVEDYIRELERGQSMDGKVAKACLVDQPPFVLPRELMVANVNEPGGAYIAQTTIQEVLIGPLKTGLQVIGCFNLSSDRRGCFTPNHILLFKSVCEQVASAVANILANEEILEREQEKTILLSLSELMSKIRTRNELWDLIATTIKPIFNFDDAVITQLDWGKNEYFVLVHKAHSKRQGDEFDRLVSQAAAFSDSAYQYVVDKITEEGASVFLTTQLAEAFTNDEAIQILAHLGLEETLFSPLFYGERLMGTINFHYGTNKHFDPNKLSLIRSLSDLLALTVANILANEEILEREREKEQLLSITRSLSQVNTRQELYAQLTGTIGQLLNYDEVVLVQCLENGDFFRHWVVPDAHSERLRQHPLYRNIGRVFPTAGTPYAQLYAPTAPRSVYWHINPAQLAHQEYWGSRLCAETGICELLIIPLTNGHTLLGNIEFATRSKGGLRRHSVEFYQNVAQQVAIVMGSILHNEALQQQTQERDLQLAVSNLLVKGVSVDELLLQLAPSINQVLLFDFLAICVPQTLVDLQMLDRVVSRLEGAYQINDRQSYLQPPTTGAAPETQPDTGSEFPFGVAACYTGDAFEAVCAEFPQLRGLRQRQRVQSVLAVPLYVGGQPELMLVLSSRHAWAYVPTDLGLLTNLSRQMSLVLDKLLAIQQLESLKNRLAQENVYLQEEVRKTVNLPNFIGQSALMQQVFQKISLVAPSDFTVLIEGETGTGKELVARALHEQSRRGDKIMVKVNCAALPANLIESELFGHEKGAFTGAIDRRIGKFELAHGGTLFLDEIGELPLELQAKLLRVIQEKEIERVGGRQVIKVDVRVIAATNKKLLAEVEARRFRQDLFYRLCVFPIEVPPLRERTEDIPPLAEFFARKASHHIGRKISGLAKETVRALQLYHWPGNVRELQHVMEHAVLTSQGALVVLSRPLMNPNPPTEERSDEPIGITTLANNERAYILRVLKLTGGRIRGERGAAKLLDINPTTLESRMQKLNIRKKEFE